LQLGSWAAKNIITTFLSINTLLTSAWISVALSSGSAHIVFAGAAPLCVMRVVTSVQLNLRPYILAWWFCMITSVLRRWLLLSFPAEPEGSCCAVTRHDHRTLLHVRPHQDFPSPAHYHFRLGLDGLVLALERRNAARASQLRSTQFAPR
jgi:hypothetical protein